MTFGEMKDLIANRLGDTSDNTKLRIGEFINDIMFRISDDVQYPGERRWGKIRTESGRYSYPLEPDVGSVIEPMIVPESNANIWMTPVETFNANIQKPTSTGVPHNYMEMGNYGVERQPATKLVFSAQDKLAIDATIYGTVDFLTTSEVLSLNQSDPTTTLKDFTTIDKITLSDTPSTTTTVFGNGASNNEVKVAAFTSSETEAATSAYGIYNPGSKVYISSTATDANRKVTVTGYGPVMSGSNVLQDNIYIEEEISPTGSDWTTEKSSGNRYTTLESVTVDAESDGTFLINADPISVRRIVSLPPKKKSLDIPIVSFYPITNGLTIRYQYYRTLTELTIDSDRPKMDNRVHNYIRKWSETAVNAWYGDSTGVTETIQNAMPSWRSDIQAIRTILGLSANPQMVIGGRARSISRRYGPSAMLDPAHYSN
tara:strand:- start:73 stop:1359 length:1287 start_codon:yes stop_codon:yes gene_type:complete